MVNMLKCNCPSEGFMVNDVKNKLFLFQNIWDHLKTGTYI